MRLYLQIVLSAVLVVSAGYAQADMVIRQSTATQTRQIGPFVDNTGAVLPALTISNTDVMLSKQGAASVAKNSGGCTYDINGMYLCTFDATDSNTAGSLQVSVVKAGALPVYHEFQVASPSIYDACCTGTSAPLVATDIWTIPGTRTLTSAANITSTGGTITVSSGAVTASSVTGAVGSVTNPVTVGTNNDKTNYALSTAGNEAVLNVVVEDMGNISARCMLALLGAVMNGDYTTAGNTTTFRDNTGVETRMTSTQTTTARTVTVTCPSY